MAVNVSKTTRIAVHRSAPGPVHLRFGFLLKLKYIRIAANRLRDIVLKTSEHH